jgi:hypothetical protein
MSDTASAGAARRPRTSPLRYAVGMFGTSIPINVIRMPGFSIC